MAAKRGPGGRFLSKAEREAQKAESAPDNPSGDNTDNEGESNMANTDTLDTIAESDTTAIEFVDELPKIHRKVEDGVWVERLKPLRDHVDRWAKVYGPTKNPHALVNNLRGGSAAGIDPSEFQFSGRMLPTGENGEKQGYVFARFLSDKSKAELEAKRAAGQSEDEDEDE